MVELKTPFIDKILKWYENFGGVEYFVDGKFVGKDLLGLPLSQNFGIKTVEDVFAYYR